MFKPQTVLPSILMIFLFLLVINPVVFADVVGYTVKDFGRDRIVTCVVVSTDKRLTAFKAQKLIASRIIYLNSGVSSNLTSRTGAPAGKARSRLTGDLRLTTGVINPGYSKKTLTTDPIIRGPDATPGMAVAFDRPVVNRPGDDIVFFEFQRPDAPPGGDAFHLSPMHFTPGVHSITVKQFDIQFDHPRALSVPAFVPFSFPEKIRDIDKFSSLPVKPGSSAGGFKALAVGIDLSDLGYAEDAKVESLFIQDAGEPGMRVDPILIAGLPASLPSNVLSEIPRLPPAEEGELLAECMDGPMRNFDEIIFAERVPGNDHWYANFGHYWCGRKEYPEQVLPENWKPDPIFKEGGRLCRYHLRTRKLAVLLDDPRGGVRDPQVHYDGRKILFSYRRGGQPFYHLYEFHLSTGRLVQLTDGPFDDIEPTYLPDGGIMFCSSRCNRMVNCWRTPVANLYRCNDDGTDVFVISTNIEHDNTPWVLPDGRILYMRWEYVDRSQLDFHHLWTANPDGTYQTVFFGNQNPGNSMLDAKPIPGTGKVVASFSPGHGRPEHMGAVMIIDPDGGPDDRGAARRISKPGQMFRDPYAVSEDTFLAADARGIWVMNEFGDKDLLCRGSTKHGRLQCHEPRPLRSRPREPVIPARINERQSSGQLVLSDIYVGRNLAGVKRGDVKKLLILEQLPKPVNFSGGPWPVSIGASFTLARVLGTVPVEEDGSAFFEIPAQRSVFFVALDANNLAVKRMQSFVSLQPGEVTGCVGCHEHRVETPRRMQNLSALERAPSPITPYETIPDVLDFPRDIQPILDRHCVRCHNPDKYDGRVDLTGDHTPLFSQSYWTLTHKQLISDGRNETHGNRAPRTIGSSASALLDYLQTEHYDVNCSERERTTVRLWIESSATYPGTYAALGSGMDPVVFPENVMAQRCGTCHGSRQAPNKKIGEGLAYQFGRKGPPMPLVNTFSGLKRIREKFGYFKFGRDRTPQSLCNLTRPDKSLLLRAPLARAAGGLGLCSPVVFSSTEDPDYQRIRSAIVTASDEHHRTKRFDMPGFRPNDHYIHQMQQYGVLPKELPRAGPVDVYETDQAYWRSFWYSNHRGK